MYIVHYSYNSGCCVKSVAPWITVLSRHTVFIKRVICYKFTFVWYSAKQDTGPHHIWRTVPFLWPREEHKWQSSWVDFAGCCLLWLLLMRLAAVFVPPPLLPLLHPLLILPLPLILLPPLTLFLPLPLLLPPPPPQNSLLTLLAFATDFEAVSATTVSLMASSSSFINFFWPLLETHKCLPCLDYCVWRGSFRNVIPVRYEGLLQWHRNRSKATMWLLYKNSSYSRVPKTLLLDWWLYVACCYPTTPTDYPSTTRGMSVDPSVTVKLSFVDISDFWALVCRSYMGTLHH